MRWKCTEEFGFLVAGKNIHLPVDRAWAISFYSNTDKFDVWNRDVQRLTCHVEHRIILRGQAVVALEGAPVRMNDIYVCDLEHAHVLGRGMNKGKKERKKNNLSIIRTMQVYLLNIQLKLCCQSIQYITEFMVYHRYSHFQFSSKLSSLTIGLFGDIILWLPLYCVCLSQATSLFERLRHFVLATPHIETPSYHWRTAEIIISLEYVTNLLIIAYIWILKKT